MQRLALSLLLALSAGAGAAAAQPEAEDAPLDDEIVVRGLRTGALEPAAGASQDLLQTEDYDAENKQLADLLSEQGGVFVRRFGGAGDRSEVSIRGSTPSQVVVTLDGVRANSVLTGGLDLSRLCLPLLESVQITRGAGSSRVGSGAVGGVIDLKTRAASAPTTRAAASAGAFDTIEGSVLHADRVGPIDYSLGYCGFDTEGDFEFRQPKQVGEGFAAAFDPERATRLNNDRQQHSGVLGVGIEAGPGELRLTDHFVHSRGGEPGLDGGNGPTAGQDTEARSRDLSNLAQLRWNGRPARPLGDEASLALHHRFERSEFENPGVGPFETPLDVTARLQHMGARSHSLWRHAPFGLLLTSELRADFSHDRFRQAGVPGRDRSAAGGSLEETLRLFDGALRLSAAARLDWTDGFEPEWLPSLGLVWTPLRWLRLRGHAGRAWRAPNFDELFHPDEGSIVGDPTLEPEDAWNADAGIELSFAQLGPFRDVSLGASVFRREIEDSIVFLLVGPNTLRPVNTGNATTDGIEFSAGLGLSRFVRLTAHHTELDSRRDRTGRRLPGQPERETTGRVQLGPPRRWKLVGEVQAVGEIGVSEGASRRLPARTIWNASASLNLRALPGLGSGGDSGLWPSELWIFAAFDNLGDAAVRDSVSFPQPGRHANAGIEAHW